MMRLAFYGRLSTTDKQDPALSFPSQRKACDRKATELGGAITCEFTDQESGAKQDRPGWSALAHEARNQTERRFDAVVIYATSRLARDRLLAALYERELRQHGIEIHYATGAGDPSTPEGSLFIGMQQLWDEFERTKLARETKRGMREASEQGYRAGGRAPYGYRRVLEALPEGHRGDRDKQRVTLDPDPERAAVVTEVFGLYVHQQLSLKGIAEHLNRPGGPPSPSHVDSSRSLRGHWAASTIRSMLANPVYTGATVWNRLDFATARQNGGAPRKRAREEWVVTEHTHLPLIDPETFSAAQDRLANRKRGPREATKRKYLLAGLVRCVSGHQPLSMHGKRRKGITYYACSYGADYGETAATEAHDGAKWIYMREDHLLDLVERFLAQRIFGPLRLERLQTQLAAEQRGRGADQQRAARRLREHLADLDRRIKAQVQALEAGIEPALVAERIAELRTDRDTTQAALAELHPDDPGHREDDLATRLARIPDLTRSYRQATPEIQRQTLDALDLRIEVDKPSGRIEISAAISEQVATALEHEKALHLEGLLVTTSEVAGAGFEPATFGL